MPKLIDVPATFNNCFFHCLAAHCLLTQQSLPQAVFDLNHTVFSRFSDHVYDESSFQHYFENESRLMQAQCSSSSFMVEKILLLGVMLRHYYAHQLRQSEVSSPLFQTFEAEFNQLIETMEEVVGEDGDIELICKQAEDSFGLILQANKHYVIQYLAQKRAIEEGKSIPEEELMPCPAIFFKQKGFNHFIEALEKNETTLSESDVGPLADMLGLTMKLLDSQEENEAPARPENCDIVLDQGHFYLKVEEGEMPSALDDALTRYRTKREEILSQYADRETQEEKANQTECLFLVATLPKEGMIEDQTPLDSLIMRWEQRLDAQRIKIPLLGLSRLTQSHLDSEEFSSYLTLENQIQSHLIEDYIEHNKDIVSRINALSEEVVNESQPLAMDDVLATILRGVNDKIDIQRQIKEALVDDLMRCKSEQDYMSCRNKYAFLKSEKIKTLNILRYYQEIISDRESQLDEIIARISDKDLQQTLFGLYQALHHEKLTPIEKLTTYQLVIDSFSPLYDASPDLYLFEKRMGVFKQTANTIKGHSKPVMNALGIAMLAVVIAAGIALGVGTLGLGVACLGGAGGLMIALGFFREGHSKGLAKSIQGIGRHANKAPMLSDKLHQVLDNNWTLNELGEYYCDVSDIREANQFAASLNKRFNSTKMRATPSIPSANRYRVILSHVSYEALQCVEKQPASMRLD